MKNVDCLWLVPLRVSEVGLVRSEGELAIDAHLARREWLSAHIAFDAAMDPARCLQLKGHGVCVVIRDRGAMGLRHDLSPPSRSRGAAWYRRGASTFATAG